MTEHEATIQSTSKGKRDIELNGLASLGYHSRLTQFLRGASRHGIKGVTTVIDFRPLYAVNVHNLQKQLVQEIKDIIERDITDRQLEVIRRLLDRYTNALRDFEFIHSNRWHTYFVKDIAASRIDNGLGSPLHSALISDAGLTLSNLQQAIFSDADILGSFDPAMLQHSQTLGETRATQREKKELLGKRKKHLVDTLQRFGFAVIGGLAI
ncbi:hypothetical protein Daesc_004710 [Daldinia eschscholtzii]|uniref:Uncharacterized protein n=1 Tax=Daldinia eschscholtzii TaxID=292717 RepID=A0AAX6MRD8_9PEZI